MADIDCVTDFMKSLGTQLLEWRGSYELSLVKKYHYKQGKEVVSQYDIEAEKQMREFCKLYFPNYKIWGEELGRDSGNLDSENFVVIDAIDGTKNYLSGNPLFASQISFFRYGVCEAAVINLPALGELYSAEKFFPAYCNDQALSVSSQTRLDLSLQCFGIGHTAQNFLTLPKIIACDLAEPRHYGCAGVHWSFLACGRTDIYIAAEAAYYDMAAGLLIAESAGAQFCQLNGDAYTPDERALSVVAANPELIACYKRCVL